MSKNSPMLFIIIILLVLIIVLLVMFGINIIYNSKYKQPITINQNELHLPKSTNSPIIFCKNGHKFIVYKNQLLQIFDTQHKPAMCKDNSTHIEEYEEGNAK